MILNVLEKQGAGRKPLPFCTTHKRIVVGTLLMMSLRPGSWHNTTQYRNIVFIVGHGVPTQVR